ncbi:MAG: class I SAM-dependent methyltransferase [Candidatus Aminicenantes bacterium]|nr:class I SAM-dependent methyltransferase [Candidatus Aminicenantes bacterium]
MNNENVFEESAEEYDRWYEDHLFLYRAELAALKNAIPSGRAGLEVGVGSGRFAAMLNVYCGIEPAESMARLAQARGIEIIRGYAEKLPFSPGTFDFLLFVTTVCFLAEPLIAFREAHRVLKEKGKIIIGFIDQNSEMGKSYQKKRESNKFYKNAHLLGVDEMTGLLDRARFRDFKFFQTLINPSITRIEIPQKGYGKGSFVVVQGVKK